MDQRQLELAERSIDVFTIGADGVEATQTFTSSGPELENPFTGSDIELISTTGEISIGKHRETINFVDCASRIRNLVSDRFDGLNRGGGRFTQAELDKIGGRYSNVHELLGPDGNDGSHMLKQTLRGQVLRKASTNHGDIFGHEKYAVSEPTANLISFLGLVHDLGELVHGDIKDSEKTELYEQQVNQTGRDIAVAILGSGSESPLVSDELIHLAFDLELGSKTDNVDYDYFEMDDEEFDETYNYWRYGVEVLEYVETGLYAATNIVKVSEDPELSAEEREVLLDMLCDYVVSSMTRNLPQLLARSHHNNEESELHTVTEFLIGKPERTKLIDNAVAYVEYMVAIAEALDPKINLGPTKLSITKWKEFLAAQDDTMVADGFGK